MAKQKMKHLIDGKVETRSTERAYSHVLVGKFNVERAVAGQVPYVRAAVKTNWKWYSGHVARGVGGQLFDDGKWPDSKIEQEDYDAAVEFTAGDFEAAVARAERAETEKQQARGNDGWVVLSWHGSRQLAEKGMARFPYYDVRVEAVNNGVAA